MKILLICNYRPGVGGISGQVALLQRHLQDEGHTADVFSTKGSLRWRLGLPRRLRKAAKGYDVLHIHCCSGWGFLPAAVGVTTGRRLGKRTVVTYHGGGAERFFAKHHRLVHHFLERSDANIVLNGYLEKVFSLHDIPCAVIPNIIESDTCQYKPRTTIHPHYICTRAHEPLYNIPLILRAFQQVQQQLPHATLTLVGNGSQHCELVQMASTMHLRNVTFTGRVPNDDIGNLLAEADILLSAPSEDNMPVSLMEAMQAGLLVIASRVGGVPYLVEDHRTGLLFDNEGELAAAMLAAVQDQATSLTIIEQARNEIAKYTWENIRQPLYKTYGLLA